MKIGEPVERTRTHANCKGPYEQVYKSLDLLPPRLWLPVECDSIYQIRLVRMSVGQKIRKRGGRLETFTEGTTVFMRLREPETGRQIVAPITVGAAA